MDSLIDLTKCREHMTVNISGRDHQIRLSGIASTLKKRSLSEIVKQIGGSLISEIVKQIGGSLNPSWRYDLPERANPRLMPRRGISV
jgi:hypothetical protein